MAPPRLQVPQPAELVRQSPFGIAVIDWDGVYESVNESYSRIYGCAQDDLLGRNFQQVFAAGRRAEILRLHQDFLRSGGSLNGLWEVQRHDGRVISVISESMRLELANGELHRLVYVVDVTELQRARSALEQREALLRDLTLSMPGVVFRMERDSHGHPRFTYCSARIEALLNLTADELLGDAQRLIDLVVPAERSNQKAQLLRCLQQQLPWQQEFQVVLADGTQRWISAHADPRVDHDRVVWTGVMTDISSRRRMEDVLRTSEETFRTLFETVPQGILYHDRDGRITSANPAALRILGLSFAQILGRSRIDPITEATQEDGSPFPLEAQPARRALATGSPVHEVVMGVRTGRGRDAWIRVSAVPMTRHGQLAGVYTSFEDITRSLELAQELRRQATTDHLTGLANRRAFLARLEEEFERCHRHPEIPAAVMLIDLDLFKQVNDHWGHAGGDAVLLGLSARMAQQVRRLDLLGRYGGEEFAALLPNTPLHDALQLAERLRAAIAQDPVPYRNEEIRITASIGLAALDPADPDAYAVLARADAALYVAKELGRNRISVADAAPTG